MTAKDVTGRVLSNFWRNAVWGRIERVIDFSFIDHRTEALYSHTGRPSVPPHVLERMMAGGYLFGITSERRGGVWHTPFAG